MTKTTCLGALLLVLVCACSQEDGDGGAGGSGGGSGGGTPAEPEPLTIVTWNVQNFVNAKIDDEIEGGGFEETDPSYPEHRAAVGAVLADIDADVVALQEVEHDRVLEDLDDTELGGSYPHIAHVDGNDPRGIDVAVISKVSIDDVVSHKEEWFSKEGTTSPDYRYSRDALEVHLTFNQRHLVLFDVHFKAKDNDDPDKRLAEAQHTRALADEIEAEHPEAAVLILGDYNDVPESPPWLAVRGMGDDAYAPAAEEVVDIDRYTYNYGGNQELVDHQMMSALLSPMLDDATILHSGEVSDASDHAPFVATYQVK